ncbi:hypothetical protein LU699_12660 [Luteimonas fraxinea]|uniref:Molybdopterin-binding protein n=1 Tax=Luteimonas fraxinea TaxID=2901869 RepID=A0ABS8UHF4_9GAMM|nr:hypothetical protein [Luteimonas fraxinea]MCD9098134.1 hypothetical protein [Luteimonas fraxinea]MCD9125336.1 hypothetical protein [Luteimonas fraxinea]UHH09141.1 hypothetical protein LU699_12660 [Luteimonas fraxinea]
MVRGLHLSALLLWATAVHAQAPETHDHAAHQRAATPADPSPVVVPLDAAARATLTRHTVEASAYGHTLRCEGVSLAALLQSSGAMPDAPLRGAHLDRYVLVRARDGYRAVFSLGELDATLGNRGVYLVDRCDGAPLDADSGPLRLLVPDDTRPARGVRQVERITVIAAP